MNNADMPAMPLAPREGGGIQTIDKMDAEFIRQCNGSIGLTKREYFAGLAMQSIIQSKHDHIKWWPDDIKAQNFSTAAAGYADALLAELERTNE